MLVFAKWLNKCFVPQAEEKEEKGKRTRFLKMWVIAIQGEKGRWGEEGWQWGASLQLVFPNGVGAYAFEIFIALVNCSEIPCLGNFDLCNKSVKRNFTMGNCVWIKNKGF